MALSSGKLQDVSGLHKRCDAKTSDSYPVAFYLVRNNFSRENLERD